MTAPTNPDDTAETTEVPERPTWRHDLVMLTKARLSFLVAVTTFVGFWLGSAGAVDGWRLFHTMLGASLAAFGASVFNQLLEIEADRRMARTKGRPLPARRMAPAAAFLIGWLLAGFALVHLSRTVNFEASVATAATLIVYIFIYTPLKLRSSFNTVVGAVAGAIPPLIGWVAAAGPDVQGTAFRWGLFLEPGAVFLFGLLFFWQLPHFLAINWMYRDQYLAGGFKMWSNDDPSGAKTARLAIVFSLCLFAVVAVPVLAGRAGFLFAAVGGLLTAWLVVMAGRFWRRRTREAARSLFLFTLLYLPLVLAGAIAFWIHP